MFIEELRKSIDKVPEASFRITNPTNQTVPDDPGYSQSHAYPEINFVCDVRVELARLTDFGAENLSLQGELYKKLDDRYVDDIAFNESKRRLLPNHRGIRPDLIIHEDQSNQNNQALALECKTSPNLSYEDFCGDLFKLMVCKEIFNFKSLVYLIVNNDRQDIETHYRSYENEHYLVNENLHVLVKEGFGAPIACIVHGENGC